MVRTTEVSDIFVKWAIRNISKKALKAYLESIGVNPDYELLNDAEYVMTFLTNSQAKWIADNFLASRQKMPIYMFELSDIPFKDLTELPEEILEKSNNLRRFKKYPKEPKLQMIYLNDTYNELVLRFVFRSPKVETWVNDETGELIKYSKPIRAFVVFRSNSPLVDIRGSGMNSTLAKKVLFKALRVLSLQDNHEGYPKRVYMNNIKFIKSLVEFAYSVDYITLEFPGEPSEDTKNDVPGRISYSGRYGNKGKDLREYKRVMEMLEHAYKSGEITRLHIKLALPEKTIFDDIASFGINFRENKLYPFRAYSEKAINEMLKILYRVWKGEPYDDLPKRKQKWLLDFIG